MEFLYSNLDYANSKIQFILNSFFSQQNNQGFLVEIHDFSFSFDGSSYLQKSAQNFNLIIFLLMTCFIFLNQFASFTTVFVYALGYFCAQFFSSFYYDQYINQMTNNINFSLNLCQVLISLCFVIQDIFKTNSDIIFTLLVVIPLGVKVAIKIKQHQNNQQLNQFFTEHNLSEYRTNQLIKIIRSVLSQADICEDLYMGQGQGIIFENIMHLHKIKCKSNLIGTCFCSKSQSNVNHQLFYNYIIQFFSQPQLYQFLYQKKSQTEQLSIQELSESHQRKSLVQKTLLQILIDYLNSSSKKKTEQEIIQLKLTIINYIHEIIQDPTKACIEMNKLYYSLVVSKKIKGSYLFYFYQLNDEIINQFQDIFNDSSSTNQRINMMGSIIFNEKMVLCRDQLRNQLLSIGIFYDQLCCDYINLQNIQIQQCSLQKSNEQLEQTFIELYGINPFNIDLQYLTSIFVQILDIENRKITDFQKQALHNNKLSKKTIKRMKEQYTNQQKDYFSERSCVIYTSLVETEYKVKKVSIQFEKIFKMERDQITNKSINMLVPKIIKEQHDLMIDNFVNKDSVNIIQQGERIAFGVDNKGFIFPITFRLKIQQSINDIGVCALIQKVQQQKQYILFTDDGKITDFSKKLYIDLFQTLEYKKSNTFLLNKIKIILKNQILIDINLTYQLLTYKIYKIIDFTEDIYSLVPISKNIVEEGLYDTQFCSSLIVQKKQGQESEKKNTISSSIHNKFYQKQYSLRDELFLLQFKVSRIQTQINFNINFLEIDYYERETHDIKKTKIINEIISGRNFNSNVDRKQELSNHIYSQKQIFDQQSSQQSFEIQQRKRRQDETEISIDDDNLNYFQIQQSPLRKKRSNHIKPTLILQQQAHSLPLQSPQIYRNDSQRLFDQQTSLTSNTELYPQQQGNNSNTFDLSYQDNKFSLKNKDSPGKKKLTQTFFNNNTINNQSINESYNQMTMRSNYKGQEDVGFIQNNNINSSKLINNQPQPVIEQQEDQIMYEGIELVKYQQYQYDSTYASGNLNSNNKFQDANDDSSVSENDIQDKLDINRLQFQFQQKQFKSKSDSQSSDYEEKEDSQADQKNEIASVNSSKFSSVELKKRTIIRRIKQGNTSKGQFIMIYTGLSAFLVLLLVTVFMYKKNIDCLDLYQKSFNQIDHAIYLFMDILDAMSFSNYKDLLKSKRASKYISTIEQRVAEVKEVDDYSFPLVREDYRYNFMKLVLETDNDEILYQLQQEKFPVIKYTSVQDEDDNYMNETMDQNLQYTIMEYFYALVQYIIQFTSIEEGFIWDNIDQFKKKMKGLQEVLQNVADLQFDNMDEAQTQIILILSVINLLLTLTVLPLSIFVQIQKENILKLPGSFQPSLLERQIKVIEFGLLKLELFNIGKDIQSNKSLDFKTMKMSQKNINSKHLKVITDQVEEIKQLEDQITNQSGKQNLSMRKIDEPQQYISRLPNKRNRSIASFSSLPKFSWLIFFTSLFAVSLLFIQPFINIFITKKYLNESKVLLNERILLLDITSQLVENQSPHYANLYMALISQYDANVSYYYDYLTNMTSHNTIQIEKIPQLSKTLEIKRFKQDRFEGFYSNILNGNLCQVKELYPSYFSSNITKSTCEKMFDGILQRGLIFSLKAGFDSFSQLYEIYQVPKFKSAFQNYMNKYNLVEINTFIKIITQSVNAIRQYQNIQSNEHHDYIYQELTLLFLIQLLIIIIVFSLGWVQLYILFNKQLTETKNIFTLFHINLLFENNFILTHLKKTHLKSKE